MGMSSHEWSRYLHEVVGLREPPEVINAEVVRRMLARYEVDLPVVPGAVEAVRRLAERRLPARARVVLEPRADRRGAATARADGAVRGDGVVRGGRAGQAGARRLPRGGATARRRSGPVRRGRGLGERDPRGARGGDARDRVSEPALPAARTTCSRSQRQWYAALQISGRLSWQPSQADGSGLPRAPEYDPGGWRSTGPIIPEPADAGSAIHARMADDVPDLPKHHRRRASRDPRGSSAERCRFEIVETPTDARSSTGPFPKEWNIRARLDRRAGRAARRRLRGFEPARPQLQRPGRHRRLAGGAPRARVHAPGESRSRPVPHLVLRRALGLLHEPAGSSTRSSRATTTSSSTRRSSRARPPTVSSSLEGDTPTRSFSRTYACHPSLANDNLSGVAVLTELARTLAAQSGLRLHVPVPLVARDDRRALLARAEPRHRRAGRARPRPVVPRRPRPVHVQAEPPRECRDRPGGGERSRDREGSRVLDWFPYGGDERQFCSPGFDLPVGAFSRTPADQFPEYHSSADDLDFVRPEYLGDSFAALIDVIDVLESNATYTNLSPYGEPQLGRRGLYRGLGGGSSEEMALLWVLSLSDGTNSLLDIAERSGLAVRGHSASRPTDSSDARALVRAHRA